jgi:hypothetical protein
MANETIAAELDIELDTRAATIALHGDLTGSKSVYEHLANQLWEASRSGHAKWIIKADDARITPEGVTSWIQAVHECLGNCQLLYKPSQLDVILQCDDRYQHRASTFEDRIIE